MKQTGIYIITNVKNNKCYIGSSSHCIKNRITVHKRFLKQNKHDNSYLQASYNKYGKDAFRFEILEYCEKEECIIREQYYMDIYKSYIRENGYNLREKAESNLNVKFSKESKRKMSIAKLGKKLTESHILNSKLARIGQKRSNRTIELQNNKKYKKVIQYSKNGDFIKEWNSLQEVESFFNTRTAIGNCIRKGFEYTSQGFKWRYK